MADATEPGQANLSQYLFDRRPSDSGGSLPFRRTGLVGGAVIDNVRGAMGRLPFRRCFHALLNFSQSHLTNRK